MGKQSSPMPPRGGEGRQALLAGAVIALLGAGRLLAQTMETNTPAQTSAAEAEARGLADFFGACFEQWHHGEGGVLSLEEVNAVIENPQARGNEAAAAVLIRWTMDGRPRNSPVGMSLEQLLDARVQPREPEARDAAGGMSLDQLLDLAQDARARRRFFQIRDHIWNVNRTVNRTLFLARDPNFLSFHQGKMQDCFFLAVVGAMVCRDAKQVRAMISASDTGYRVDFPSGRSVLVPFLTDAEMVMGASVGIDHGIWLSVLEKAYGLARRERWENRQRENAGAGSGGSADVHSATTADIIGHGGSTAPVIALFTGHRVTTERLDQWLREDSRNATNRLHQLLVELVRGKQLTTVSGAGYDASTPVPKAIIRRHVFALLGYRAAEKRAVLFNPWGNRFDPDGPPGLVNGYPTRNGVFEIPLEHLLRTFSHLDYETEESL
ncbi:MAG: hypothetical protein ACLQVX_22695 [Limisphaerales bacterium]